MKILEVNRPEVNFEKVDSNFITYFLWSKSNDFEGEREVIAHSMLILLLIQGSYHYQFAQFHSLSLGQSNIFS